jgi:hypothetical protein
MTRDDLLRAAILSGQVSAAQIVAHWRAGEYRPLDLDRSPPLPASTPRG